LSRTRLQAEEEEEEEATAEEATSDMHSCVRGTRGAVTLWGDVTLWGGVTLWGARDTTSH
jgi:hypothetical protein